MGKMIVRFFAAGALLSATALLMGPYGCTPNPTPPTPGQTCTKTEDCGANNVCDTNLGKCFKDCTITGFTGCDDGNACDNTLKRCTCTKDACEKLNDSGCNPVTNVCETHCKDDTGCTSPEKCIGEEGKKFCFDPAKAECDPANNKADNTNEKCTAAPKTYCDSATRKCMEPPVFKCTDNTKCTADPKKSKCETTSGQCVECLQDADCTDAMMPKCDMATHACSKSPDCTDTATCYTSKATTYCDEADKAKGCQEAAAAGCTEVDYSGNNASWATDIAAKKGSIIWGAKKLRRYTDDKNCVDTDGNGIPNGMVEVEFSFYNPAGNFSTCYKCLKWGDGSKTFEFPTEQWSVSSGDKTSGKAKFVLCRKSGGMIEFVAWEGESDSTDNPSNGTCANLD